MAKKKTAAHKKYAICPITATTSGVGYDAHIRPYNIDPITDK